MVPLVLCAFFTIIAIWGDNAVSENLFLAMLWLAVAVALGLISSGILLRRNRTPD